MKRIMALLFAVLVILPIISVNVLADNAAPAYEKVTLPVEQLEEGVYVFVNSLNGATRLMKTESVEISSRIGFKADNTTVADGESIQELLPDYEWTLTKTDSGKWLVGANGKFMKLADVSGKGIAATLEDVGDEFTITLNNGKYELSNGTCVLNANGARPLFNGYAHSPAQFYIYKKSAQTEEPMESGYYEKTAASAADLEEGTYIMVHNVEGDGDCFVMPSSAVKDGRQGLDLLGLTETQTDINVKANSIEGVVSSFEWILTKTSDGKWLLGSKSGYAKITEVSGVGGTSIILTSEEDAGEFTIEKSGVFYTISSVYNGKTYYFNFNKRMVINGWEEPAKAANIVLYKKTDKPDDTPRSYPVTVIACSDFQNPQGDNAGAAFVGNILNRIKADAPTADVFLCAGDYDYDMSSKEATNGGIGALSSAVKEAFGKNIHEVYVEGNHDAYDSELLASSGNNDPDDGLYGVFVINEDDYMWGSNAWNSQSHPGMSSEDIIKQTAASLQTYLDAKIADRFTAPIFVISHLPLHYSMRTKLDGDGMYANYLFGIMNEAADNGLNIIYLYGHDHSHGWDDYLGGSVVYLEKGCSINIAQASRTSFNAETLNFTYMNAGYVGYYENHNGGETTLTMSLFTITEDSVIVSRYTKDGVYQLKSAGVHNSNKGETDSDYLVDSTVTESPQTIILNKNITVPVKYTDGATGISVTSKASNVSVFETTDESFASHQYKNVKLYQISGDDLTGTALVEVPVGNLTSVNCKIFILSGDSNYEEVEPSFSNGMASFKIGRFTKFAVCELNPESGYYKQTVSADELEEGTYIIVYESSFMNPDSVKKEINGNGLRQGFDLTASSEVNVPVIKNMNLSAYEWTLSKTDDGKWLLSSESGYAAIAEVDGVGGTSAIFVDDEANAGAFTISKSGDAYTFASDLGSNTLFLNYNSRGVINAWAEPAKAANLVLYKKVIIKKPTYVAVRPIFEDKIALEYVVDLPDVTESPQIIISIDGVPASTTTAVKDENGMWRFTCLNIVPAKLDSQITVEIVGSDADIPAYSVKEYCAERLKNSADETYKQLISDLLRYGAVAQTFETDMPSSIADVENILPARSDIAPYENRYENIGEGEEKVWIGATLVLENTITMRLYYHYSFAPTADAIICNSHHNIAVNTERKYIEITGFTPLDYDEIIEASFNGKTIKYSVGSYIARMSENCNNEITKQIVSALQNYGRAAEAYAINTNQG